MTTPMPDLDNLARGLTDAQREAIRRGGIGDERMTTVNALRRKGLMHLRIDSPNGRWGFMELTPLGLALRAHIERTTHD